MKPSTLSVPPKYYHHIDLLRFILSVIIIYSHIHSNISPYVKHPMYATLAGNCSLSSNVVVCFFIVGGIFLYNSHKRNPDASIFDYIVGRIARLWPILVFALLTETILRGSLPTQRTLLDSLFLQCSGLSLEYEGILWYISSYFFASILLYSILNIFSEKRALFIIALLTYFSYTFLINYNHGYIGGRDTVLYFLNRGMVRAVGGIGLGIVLACASRKLHEMYQLCPVSRITKSILFVLQSLTEIGSLIFLYRYIFLAPQIKNHIILVVVLAILLMSMLSENSLCGYLLNRRFLGFFGQYAYSIYAMQQSSFLILRKTLWLNESFTSNPVICLAVSVALAVLFGIAIYYIVELPCTKIYTKWNKKYLAAKQRMNIMPE